MSKPPKIFAFDTIPQLVDKFRADLSKIDYIVLYAFNGTGKTRLSMEFKDAGKRTGAADTLYFNAFTEDLFHWDNDLPNDAERVLEINSTSRFFNGFKELALEEKIFAYLERYADFDFKIDYDKWLIRFTKGDNTYIKISRGEENIFIWCIFLAICQLTIEGEDDGPYSWVKYFYIDDPISSLDDNNATAVASDLANLLKGGRKKIKTVISTHHSLFFNVMFNELKKFNSDRFFLHKSRGGLYKLQSTNDTPFFHHVASLSELKQAMESDDIKTYHFNMLRSILEKTSSFLGFNDFGKCIHGVEDDVLYERALNLFSHGKYSIYEPVPMGDDTKDLFIRILRAFLDKYKFELPALLAEGTTTINPA